MNRYIINENYMKLTGRGMYDEDGIYWCSLSGSGSVLALVSSAKARAGNIVNIMQTDRMYARNFFVLIILLNLLAYKIQMMMFVSINSPS